MEMRRPRCNRHDVLEELEVANVEQLPMILTRVITERDEMHRNYAKWTEKGRRRKAKTAHSASVFFLKL